MNRHEAYGALSRRLEEYRALPFAELQSLVGRQQRESARVESGEEIDLDILIAWVAEPHQVLVRGIANSRSSFRLERLEEEITISREGSTVAEDL